jgi:hypothetical protein
MKHLIVPARFMVLLFITGIIFGQDLDRPEPFDELSAFNCSEYSREALDMFFIELQNKPDKKGLIVLYGEDGLEGQILAFRKIITRHAKFRNFDPGRFDVIRTANAEKAIVRFWILEPDSNFGKSFNEYKPEPVTGRLRFDRGYASLSEDSKKLELFSGEESCDLGINFADYAARLSADQNLKGQVIVYTDSAGKFNRMSDLLIKELNEKYKIARSRLEITYGGTRDEPEIELWLIPENSTPPTAELFDEYGEIPCGDVLNRLDLFFVELQNDPDAKGIAVIQIKNDDIRTGFEQEQLIRGNVAFRNFPAERLEIVRTTSDDEFRVQYWVVPDGTELPDLEEKGWDLKFSGDQKPFLFTASSNDVVACPGIDELGLNFFAEYLNANPKARGNIVLKTPSDKKFAAEKRSLIESITGEYKIPSSRLRFFRVRKKEFNESIFSPEVEVEFWILP